jgi:hypothetical protein
MRRLVESIFPLVLAGCMVDFTEPQPDEPTGFAIGITHPEPLEFTFHGELRPGTDGDGRRIAVLDDTIRVGPQRFGPTGEEMDGRLIYMGGWTDDPTAGSDLIEVVPPRVQARTAPAAPRVRVMRRAGAGDVFVAPGDSLVFSIDPGPNLDQAPQSKQWTVEISSQSPAYRVSFSDTTSLPTRLAFPPEMIPGDWTELAVLIQVNETWEAVAGYGGYEVRITATSHLRWSVRRVDAGLGPPAHARN